MREILFKAKQIDNGEWVEGAYCKLDSKQNAIPHIICYADDDRFGDWIEVISETVCQYTGLTDKNGVKIFDGDVVRWKCYNGAYYERPVQYDAEWNHFCVRLNGEESCGANKHLSTDIEIVGNIHDKEHGNG